MSQSRKTTLTPNETVTEASDAKPRSRRRRWLRRLGWLVLLAIVARAALQVAAEPIARKVASGFGIDLRWESLDLSLAEGRVELWGLEADVIEEEEEDGEPRPLFSADTIALDVDIRALFTGTIRVRRLELDGARVDLSRDAAGRWNLETVLASFAGDGNEPAEPEPDEDADDDDDGPIVLESPIQVIAARAQDITIHLRDEASEPTIEVTSTVSIVAANVGVPHRTGRFDLVATSPGMLDILRIHGTGGTAGSTADLDLDVRMSSLDLRPIAPVLRSFGLEPVAASIDARAQCVVRVEPVTEAAEKLAATLRIDGAELTHDGEEALALDALLFDFAEISRREIVVRAVEIDGARARAGRTAEGALSFTGLVLGDRTPPTAKDNTSPDPESSELATSDPDASDPDTPDSGAPDPSDDMASAEEGGADPFRWRVESVQVRDCQLSFLDRALVPAIDLAAQLDELGFGPIASGNQLVPSGVVLRASMPGVAERIEVNGTVRCVLPAPSMTFSGTVTGIDPAAISPYLAMVGVDPVFESGTVGLAEFGVEGSADGGLELRASDLVLSDAGAELGAVGTLEVDLVPGARPRIVVAGVRAELTKRADSTIVALGLRYGGDPAPLPLAKAPGAPERPSPSSATAPSPASETAPSPQEAPAFEVPDLQLPTIRLQLERLRLVDEASAFEPVDIGPLECLVESATDVAGETGYDVTVDGHVRLARDFEAALRLQRTAAPSPVLRVTGQTKARGINLAPLASWLALAGIEPVLTDGSFEAGIDLSVQSVEGLPVVDVVLEGVRLSDTLDDGVREWLGLERMTVSRLIVGEAVDVASVEILSPRMALQRDLDGGLRALGVRLLPSSPNGAAVNGAEAAPTPKTPSAGSAPKGTLASERSAASDDAAAEPLRSGALRLGRLAIAGAEVRLDDLALPAPHSLDIGADLELTEISPGLGAGSTMIDGTLRVAGSSFTSRGEVTLDPTDLRVGIDLAAEGLAGTALAPYLPPGLEVELQDGTAAGRLDARLARTEAGGWAISLGLSSVALQESGAERPLLSLASLRLEAPRVDPEESVFEIADVAVEGLELDAVRTSDGGIRALGVVLVPPPTDPSDLPSAAGPIQPEESVGEASSGEASAAGSGRTALPEIRIDRIDLAIAALHLSAEATPDLEPRVVTARFALDAPFVLDVDPESEQPELTPLAMTLSAGAAPGLEAVELRLVVAPFEDNPRIDATVAVRGINAAELLAIAPELADKIDASGLVDGTFAASLESEFSWRRRGPMDFDVSGGFGADISVRDVAFRRTPEADVALGVDRIDVQARRIVPSTGLVHLARLEVERPRGRVRRTTGGIEIGGLVLLATNDETAIAESPDTDVDEAPISGGMETEEPGDEVVDAGAPGTDEAPKGSGTDPSVTRVAPAPMSAGPASEFRVDSILISEIDVHVEDTTVEPALVLPLETLGIEVRGFSTRALTEPLPIRFSAYVGAGEVSLPERREQISLLRGVATGVAGGVASVVTGKKEEVTYEGRPLFYEAATSGRLTLVPKPSGWIRASLSGFELVGVRGLARQSGVEIGDGVLDFNTRVTLSGSRGGRVNSVSSFAYLSLSEPDGGPISRFLKLPAPLGTVLFVLKNDQGEHRVPLSFDIGKDGSISGAGIAAKASATFLGLVTEALASSPMRAVGTVTDIVGLGGLLGGGDRKPKYAGIEVGVAFDSGSVRVSPEQVSALDEIVEAMKKDPLLDLTGAHTFVAADIARAAELASPERGEAEQVLRSLRAERAQLGRRRDELIVLARSELNFGNNEGYGRTRTDLLAVERRLGEAEAGIDRIAELLRPGVEKRRDRRTRVAALAIAGARLDEVRRVLLDAGISYERFSLRQPRFEVLEPEAQADEAAQGAIQDRPRARVTLVTKGGTPPKGFFRRILSWVGL